MTLVVRLKRLFRPLIPDPVMAWHRLAQQSRRTRLNVDVYVATLSEARRWLRATPDTYRVGLVENLPAMPGRDVVGLARRAADGDAELAARLAAAPGVEVGVVGVVDRPRLIGRSRAEPAIEPVAIAARGSVLAEVEVDRGTAPEVALHRLRAAGRRLALVPRPGQPAPGRTDPITGDVIVVLAAVPMHDVGGGSRGAQLAVEFARRGMHVVYVSMFPTHESTDLGIRFIHPRLEQYRLDEFDVARLLPRLRHPGVVMVEIPAPRYQPAIGALGVAEWHIVYDMVDLWSDLSLGGEWYDGPTERAIVAAANTVIASAPDLVVRAAGLGRTALLVPNAVNTAVFGAATPTVPADLADLDGVVVGYHGSLYGDWFDWGALRAVAESHPAATVVVIGDDRGGHPAMPGNVRFLGLRSQVDLPGYLSRMDVGLVPFAVTPVTHAVSPLKVYEYLACGVPVAAPPLRALVGTPGVYTDTDLRRAVDAALAAPRPDRVRALREHGWGSRVESLFGAIGRRAGEAVLPAVRIVMRPVVHHPHRRRRVRS